MFSLCQQLKTCKVGLKAWSLSEFGNNRSVIAFLKDQLVKLQVVLSSMENCQAQQQIQDELADVLQREEMFLHQQSWVRWLQCGDHNSMFFHASITQVLQLLNESDQQLTSDEDINAHFLDYFSKLFTSNNPRI